MCVFISAVIIYKYFNTGQYQYQTANIVHPYKEAMIVVKHRSTAHKLQRYTPKTKVSAGF